MNKTNPILYFTNDKPEFNSVRTYYTDIDEARKYCKDAQAFWGEHYKLYEIVCTDYFIKEI